MYSFVHSIHIYIYIHTHTHIYICFVKKTDLNTPKVIFFFVTNLYSNISHEFEKQAISFWIGKYPQTLHSRFNKKFITDGIESILNLSNLITKITSKPWKCYWN